MTQNNGSFGLKELVSPLPIDEFINEHWLRNVPVVIHSDLSRFSKFPSLQELLSFENFANTYHGRVSMIHPNGSSVDVNAGSEALTYLSKGYTVYFRHIQNYFPKIRLVLDQLASDLSMPPSQFTAEIFTSSGLSGVPFHSDYDLNLSLLLSGESKEWTFAKNLSILNQTGICMPAGVEQIESSQTKYFTDIPLPSKMPPESVTEVLRPGDMIFMPRGWWHATRSVGNCLCVNFVMKGPHWARLFSSSLEKILVEDSRWRDYPYWVASQGVRKEEAVNVLTKLVDDYKEALLTESSRELALKLIEKYLDAKTKTKS